MTIDPAQLRWFAAFWQLYPRKVAKKAAEKAWAKLAPDAALVEQIMAGLRAQLSQMRARDKQFIPHPATWLRGERWNDEIEQPKPLTGHALFLARRELEVREYRERNSGSIQ